MKLDMNYTNDESRPKPEIFAYQIVVQRTLFSNIEGTSPI